MTDAFASLRLPLTPVDPDPRFAQRLRARLADAVAPSRGAIMATVTDPAPAHETVIAEVAADLVADAQAAGAGTGDTVRHGDAVYLSLWVPDAERAAAFFGDVLGWTSAPAPVGHARQVEGTTPPQGIHGGHQRSSLFACYGVDDLDAAIDRVRAAGGQAEEPMTEDHGTTVGCTDDQGTPFALYLLGSDGSTDRPRRWLNGRRQGDLSYLTLLVGDSARFRAFYSHVLGWRFEPGRVDDGWGVVDVAPMVGLQGGHPDAIGIPMYRVDDIEAAVARVRAGGGTSTDPEHQPYGISAECTDDQGTRFYLGQDLPTD